jgi:hypothetical protein
MDDLKTLLEKLHYSAAKHLLEKIDDGTATSADFTAAIQLLKHNGIQVDIRETEDGSSGIMIDDKTRALLTRRPSDDDYIT